MWDIFNHKVKVYPDGTCQHYIYSRCIEIDSPSKPLVKKTIDKDTVKRKEIDNQKRARVEVFDICRSNEFEWFFTLTFDPIIVDSYDYKVCVDNLKRFTKWLGKCGTKYIFVPEQHESGRWHFHGLVGKFPDKNRLHLRQAYNSKTGLKIDGVWNIENYKLGFSTCSKIKNHDRVSSYICKYLTKDMQVPKGCKRYWCTSGLNRPMICTTYSDHIEDDIDRLYRDASYIKVMESEFLRVQMFEVQSQ